MTVEILRMGPSDVHRLTDYDDDIFDEAVDSARLAAYLADPGHLMVCAFAGGVAIGQVRGVLTRQPDAANSLYVDNLGVAPSRRREGIAGRLLDELVAWGREQGCATAWVATELDNDAARALYAGRGAEFAAVAYYTYTIEPSG
ncbi:MAG: GNAT family N-acetyltransferase [Nannocystis sp.]|nr:GNAT family N-acetyltransferase [Nannocystis sp.]